MAGLIALHVGGEYGWLGPRLSPATLPGRMIESVAIPICLGALLAQALNSRKGFRILYSVIGHKWSCLVSLGILLAALYPLDLLWTLAWVGLIGLIGACVIREDHALAPLLRLRWLAYIGVVSYGMYLFNTLAVRSVRGILGHIGIVHPLLTFPVIVGVTFVVAFLSYRYFESPFLSLKSRFTRVRQASTKEPEASVIGGQLGSAGPTIP
jgi:peptidoglycan/LPS O-acetylase OafA/YrhL